ncbi:MAG: tetratricopeptide repeat protein, partial [Chloroflexota bacterium]
GLKIAQQEWPQIQQWQAWVTARAGDQPEAAQMCSAYSLEGGELLDLILTPSEQRVWYETGLSAARHAEDQRAELAHLLALSVVYDRLAHEKTANECALQALALADSFEDQNSTGKAHLLLGKLALKQGSYPVARSNLEQSVICFRALGDRRDLASALYNLGKIAFAANDLTTCRQYLDESLSLYQQLGDELGVTTILHVLRVYSFTDPTKGLEQVNVMELLRAYQQTGDRLGAAEMLRHLSSNALYTRDFPTSQYYMRQALDLDRQLQMPRQVAQDLLALGVLSLIQTRYVDGRDELLECLAICRHFNFLVIGSRTLVLLAFAYWGLRDVESARANLREGMNLAREAAPEVLALGIVALAALRLLANQSEDAAVLVGVAAAYPGTAADTRMFAVETVRQLLAGVLDSETLAAALERGKALDYEATVAALIAELSE